MKRRAFSLIETLVVVGIILVISGILLPVLVSSKRQAMKVDDLSKLRQLGQAFAMYENEYADVPVSTVQLVAQNMVPPEFCASMRDTSVEGIANRTSMHTNKLMGPFGDAPVAPFKRTFVGLGEFAHDSSQFREWILSGPGAGWLIDATESEQTGFDTPTQWKGRYKRLSVEGSVMTREHRDVECYPGGVPTPCRTPPLLFVDPNPAMVARLRENGKRPGISAP